MAEKSWKNVELVLYEETLENPAFWDALSDSKAVEKYAWILHPFDENKIVHGHFMLQFSTPKKTSTICNRFGIRENQIEKIKGSWADALDYLTHHNAPHKHQYNIEDVHSNFDWKEEAKGSKYNKNQRKEEIIEKISSGEIRRYNETDFITPQEFERYYSAIRHAYEYRDSYVKAHLEEIVEKKNVCWIYGDAGTGKTTLAKHLAKSVNLFYRLTSTGQHMFDEYQDEPCLIMDDLRPEEIKFIDLLGILDPYNFKTAYARYKNKALQTEMIIVTSLYSPEVFLARYGDVINSEDKNQLYRRIAYIYKVTTEKVEEYEYNQETYEKQYNRWFPNPFIELKKREQNKSIPNAMEKLIASFY